jgi:nucleoside-diphosphate-sugar epimerase
MLTVNNKGDKMKKVLVTGATGQIGSELTVYLRKLLGGENVIAAGHNREPGTEIRESGPFKRIDCTNIDTMAALVKKYKIDTIFHLAAILSATAEKNPQIAWHVNVNGLYNVLEIARECHCSVFTPSSIATFGPATPMDQTPQDTVQRPTTIYGITKVTGELLCNYYHIRFGVDTRGLRYPGLISYKTPPGGGTTDYAVEIFFEAVKHAKYTCYLRAGTCLDMMYMPDALRAAVELMEVDDSKLKHRNAFNITAMTLTPETLASAIQTHIPEFEIDYDVDPLRQAIADSWPNSMDDHAAREEWGWKPQYSLETMTTDMIRNISQLKQYVS